MSKRKRNKTAAMSRVVLPAPERPNQRWLMDFATDSLATGRSKLSELGGLARAIPLTLALYMIGALSISAFPLFSSFVSKSMVVYAAGQNHMGAVVLLLYLVSIATFLSVGLKLPYFTWLGHNRSLKPTTTPVGMYLSMALTAGLCIAIGVYPSLLYNILPFTVEYQPYTTAKVVETMHLMAFTGLGFWVLVHKLGGKDYVTLDTDWFYRRLPRLAYELACRLFVLSGGRRAYDFCQRLPRLANRLAYELFVASGGRQAYDKVLPIFREYTRDIALGALVIAVCLGILLVVTLL